MQIWTWLKQLRKRCLFTVFGVDHRQVCFLGVFALLPKLILDLIVGLFPKERLEHSILFKHCISEGLKAI